MAAKFSKVAVLRDGQLVEILKMPQPHRLDRATSGHKQHRGTIEVSIRDTCQCVDVGDTAAHRTDAYTSA